MKETDAAYIAGLFDGEGHVIYKQYPKQRKGQKKAYPTWQIRLEIAMTDKSVLVWLNEILGVGTVGEKDTRQNTLKVGRNNGVGVAHIAMHSMSVV